MEEEKKWFTERLLPAKSFLLIEPLRQNPSKETRFEKVSHDTFRSKHSTGGFRHDSEYSIGEKNNTEIKKDSFLSIDLTGVSIVKDITTFCCSRLHKQKREGGSAEQNYPSYAPKSLLPRKSFCRNCIVQREQSKSVPQRHFARPSFFRTSILISLYV